MIDVEDLSDDPEIAFSQYVLGFEGEFLASTEDDPESNNYYYELCMRYMINVLAAASALELEILADWEIPENDHSFYSYFQKFRQDVQFYVVRTRIKIKKDNVRFSVTLTLAQKEEIYTGIDKIQSIIEQSPIADDKKEQLLTLLSKLRLEIAQDRTRFSRVADVVRRIAGISNEVEKTGIKPYYKYIQAIFGVVDNAKEEEIKSIPVETSKKRIAPPPKRAKQISSGKSGLDDEIPF